jgi:uncharacterized protein YecE (DUF72 family)
VQTALFPDSRDTDGPSLARVQPAVISPEIARISADLAHLGQGRLFMGTSSWHFPGWSGLVWARPHPQATLSRCGLSAYARHPLFRTVSLDRAFYRALDALAYARLAKQVPAGFAFVVKAPAAVTDATLRDAGSGRPVAANPRFLDPALALEQVVRPAAAGLGAAFGVLVFQLSPLPREWLADAASLIHRLERLWQAVLPELSPGTLAAIELRDPELLTPRLAASLKAHGVRFCLGLHDRMPVLQDQLGMLRATWPGDLVCRWSLQRGLHYAQAKERWAPFDRLQAPDLATRSALATVIAGTLAAGYRAFVTVNNKAEGSAPLSVAALAGDIVEKRSAIRQSLAT